jgi:hypothetical protein
LNALGISVTTQQQNGGIVMMGEIDDSKLKHFLKRNLSTSGRKIVGKKIKDKLDQGKEDS